VHQDRLILEATQRIEALQAALLEKQTPSNP
jgi:hypothetical protein